ncbi:MAG TPA: CoA ester lyase [Dehalococcoidia bacterium]|nr:CoA ester lyase [Dehalococcoidia bacterium]
MAQLMRTHLFVPANRANMVAKAHQVAADVIVLDLEDSVPPAEKDAARAGVRDAIASLNAAGKTVHVRVNHLSTGLTRDDLDAAVGPGLSGLVFPKVEGGADIRELDVLIRQQEVQHQVRAGTNVLIPHIESARGLLRCEDIVLASTRIGGLSIGAEDYVADIGVARTPGGQELEYARRISVNVCAAYRLQALDVVYPQFQDEAGLLADARYARSIGFKGKYVIHPTQVDAVNAVFAPSADEVETARRIVAAFDEAVALGHASTQVDGRMVDTPTARRARDVITYAEAMRQAD